MKTYYEQVCPGWIVYASEIRVENDGKFDTRLEDGVKLNTRKLEALGYECYFDDEGGFWYWYKILDGAQSQEDVRKFERKNGL